MEDRQAEANSELLNFVGARVRALRLLLGVSQEEFSFRCDLDRTYISDIERGNRNVSLINLERIASNLGVPLSKLFTGMPSKASKIDIEAQETYSFNKNFRIKCGFDLSASDVVHAALMTSTQLEELPFALFKSIDLKSLSGMVGALFAATIAEKVDAIVNPIEKGHPDVLPRTARNASEKSLRNYPEGLEIKCTIGNVSQGSDLAAGTSRIEKLQSITWQAHHREVKRLMGVIIDFAKPPLDDHRHPMITGVFYSDELCEDDWGEISGTTGRNTKVTGMRASGKKKMGKGWVALLKNASYAARYGEILDFKI